MLAYPADGQKLGWETDSERMGSPGGRVCETLRGLRSVFCSQSARAGYGRAEHMCSCGEPLETGGLLWDAQGDVMAARVVGIRQEGIKSLPDGAVQEGRGTRAAAMTSRARSKVHDCELPRCCASCELPRWCCALKKNGE